MRKISPINPFFASLNKVNLSFKDKALEEEFKMDYQLDTLVNVKVAISFSILVYALFSILDYLVAPELYAVFVRIRFIYVLPMAVVILLFFQFKLFLKYGQQLCMLLMILAGFGIIAMVVLGGENLLQYYYVGLILVLIFNYDFLKLRFIYATFSGWMVVLVYGAACYFSEISRLTVVMSGFFLVSANLFGMMSAYYFEYIVRRNFYSNKLLLEEREKTESINKSLEKQVDERSRSLREANQGLKEAEKKYRTMLERSNDMIWTTDADDRITFINHQFETSLHCSFADLSSACFANFVHPGHLGTYREKVALLRQGFGVDYSIKVTDPQGKNILLGIHATPLNDEQGFVGVVHFGINETLTHANEVKRRFIHQISEKINSSIQLNDLAAYIHHEISMVLEISHFFVAMVNADDQSLDFLYSSNPGLDGYDINNKTTIFHYVAHTGKSFLGTHHDLERLSASGLLEVFNENARAWLVVPIKKLDQILGAVALVHYTNPQAFTDDDLEMMEIISHYISQLIVRQKTETKLRVALSKATESDRLKSTFLATMSHELRTPLNAIIGFSGLIDENSSKEEVLDYAHVINSSGEHLLKIVKDILNVTLLETGEIELNEEEVELNQIISELIESTTGVQHEMGKSHVKLDWKQLEYNGHLVLTCDRQFLRQVFGNLLQNALKFTMEGSISVGCDLMEENGQHYIKFSVIDTGIGIANEQQELVFDLFRQVDDSYTRRFGGVGVGLSVAAKIVHIMGGRIWLESELGKGSSFYFTIPNVADAELTASSSGELPLEAIPDDSKPNISPLVLIVDDVETSFRVMSAMLRKLNIKSLWAKTGEEAISLCHDHHDIRLVLMDLKMPTMDGYEATGIIKTEFPHLPIIAQTAYAIVGDRDKAIEVGCDDYITKPIIQKTLFEVIDKYLDK